MNALQWGRVRAWSLVVVPFAPAARHGFLGTFGQWLVSVCEAKEGILISFHAKDCTGTCAIVDTYTTNPKRKGATMGSWGLPKTTGGSRK